MSRIPQPPATRNTARTPSKTSTSTSLRVGSGANSARKLAPSPTPTGRPLRPQTSLKSVKPPPSPQKSPARRPAKLDDDQPISSARAPVSIREQIALKRAEAKKATGKGISSGALEDLSGLEEALPTNSHGQDDSVVDLGRWSVKETIERARTTGEYVLLHQRLSIVPSYK